MITITIYTFWPALYHFSNKYYWSSQLLLKHPPSDLQRVVLQTHVRLHLHLPVHALRQPECKRMACVTEASLRVVHSGCDVLVPAPVTEVRNFLLVRGGLMTVETRL